MYHGLKSKMANDWQPTACISNLQLRAQVFQKIRQFFEERKVLEVETPLLSHSTVTDPGLASFTTTLRFAGCSQETPLYLQTSPEFAMKRLLAAGSGSIFQISKAFRNGEVSKKHNPEFTLLEWYQVSFTHFDLMAEVDEFLTHILATKPSDQISYHDLFDSYFAINPHTCSIQALKDIAKSNKIDFTEQEPSKDIWLDLLLTHLIEPHLGMEKPLFIYDYPATQAALAKTRQENGYLVGERFEVYFKGVELANGYHELGDASEQEQRFMEDNKKRFHMGLPQIPIDKFLLKALASLPDCAGVALGLDRLITLAAGAEQLSDMMAFPIARA